MKSIIVLWYGWVLVGRWDKKEKRLYEAQVIRRWGTTKGLGELINGPLQETILEPIGDVDVPQKPLFIIEAKGWK